MKCSAQFDRERTLFLRLMMQANDIDNKTKNWILKLGLFQEESWHKDSYLVFCDLLLAGDNNGVSTFCVQVLPSRNPRGDIVSSNLHHGAFQVPNLFQPVGNCIGFCSTVRSGIEFPKNFLVHVVIVVVIDLILIFKIVCW